jgi:UDP:flavonoid glycosyltransferase YjiC (YdhE family)
VSRILLTWELGGNLGHITPLRVLARALRERGHEVSFALRDLRAGANLLKQDGFRVFQAPVIRLRATDLPPEPASYPEMLLHCGFADPSGLAASVRSWRNLFRGVGADLLVFDYAPTAMLAARGTGIPRVIFGTGFCSPPRVSPMPSIRPWEQISSDRLEASEQRALATANAALNAAGSAPLGAFHELLDAEENLLTTFPELDHYPNRAGGNYIGPIQDLESGQPPHWPAGEGKKVFVYLRPNSPAFGPLAALLRTADAATLWFAPGMPKSTADELQSESLRFVTAPVDIARVANEADAVICHAGHGTTAALLMRGVPLLLIPETVEQLLLARNVAALGAGGVITPSVLRGGLREAVLNFLGSDPVFAGASGFAAKYGDFDGPKHRALVLARIDQLAYPSPARSVARGRR